MLARRLRDSIRKRWIRERFDAWEKGKPVPSRLHRKPKPLKRLGR